MRCRHHAPEDRLHGHNCVAVRKRLLVSRVRKLFVDDDDVVSLRDAGSQQVVQTVTETRIRQMQEHGRSSDLPIDRSQHPEHEREVADGFQEVLFRPGSKKISIYTRIVTSYWI